MPWQTRAAWVDLAATKNERFVRGSGQAIIVLQWLKERRRVGGSSPTPLPTQAWPGRIMDAKPASILLVEGQQNVSSGRWPAFCSGMRTLG